MPRSLSAGHTKVAVFPTRPSGDLEALALSVFTSTGVIDAACRIAMADFELGVDDDDTFTDQALCEDVAAETPGNTKFKGQWSPYRYFDAEGKAETGTGDDEIGDALYQLVKVKGTGLWVARRDTSKMSKEAWGEGDEYKLYRLITGSPGESPQEGYIKHPQKLFVQERYDGIVAAAA